LVEANDFIKYYSAQHSKIMDAFKEVCAALPDDLSDQPKLVDALLKTKKALGDE
jgi:hypothetical protein